MKISIEESINAFNHALMAGKFLVCDSQGYWFTNKWGNYFLRMMSFEEKSLINAAKAVCKILESLEKAPVCFSNHSNQPSIQIIDFQSYIFASQALLKRLKVFSSKNSVFARDTLNRLLVGLLYRLEGVNGGLDPVPASPEIIDQLALLALEWKLNQTVFKHKYLTITDNIVMQEVCQYPELIHIILANDFLREEFFLWTLRDRISVRSFIEFPAIQRKLVDCSLNGRIGRLGGHFLKIQKKAADEVEGSFWKILTLPFEGKDISILDEQKIVLFRGNYGFTIAQVFKVFKNKHCETGNLEFMAEGIINWNTHLWGWWDEKLQEYQKIDLGQPMWWKQLPVLEVLTLKQARSKYGKHLDGSHWNISATATRQSPTLDYRESHAYSSIAIPIEKGNYIVYPFGKFATRFPATLLNAFANLGETSEATIAYPDENIFYTHRQRTRFSYALTKEQGLKCMELIKQDMLSALQGDFIYQIQSENCAKWSYKLIEKVMGIHRVPNLFQMPFLDSEPEGIMKMLFICVKSLPKSWQIPVTTFCHLPLGATKGRWIVEQGRRVWKSLTHHSFWADTLIYHPALLHKQQEVGVLGHYVAAGVTGTDTNFTIICQNLWQKLICPKSFKSWLFDFVKFAGLKDRNTINIELLIKSFAINLEFPISS
jgi:hypothetical protein